jgi:hypothetical protein
MRIERESTVDTRARQAWRRIIEPDTDDGSVGAC